MVLYVTHTQRNNCVCSLLPAPSNRAADRDDERGKRIQLAGGALVATTAPPYGHRKGWVPRKPEDFGDGGAFPETPVAQFPLGLLSFSPLFHTPLHLFTTSNPHTAALDVLPADS